MKFLYIRAAKSIFDLPIALKHMGHEVDIVENYTFDPSALNPEGQAAIREYLDHNTYDFAISYLFFGEVSDIFLEYGLKYIAWVYDSPLISLYEDAVSNPNNYLFIFDRKETKHLQSRNIPHLYHLPMGVNTTRTGALAITPEDEQKFSCDISFVGNLYEDNTYNKFIHIIPEKDAVHIKYELMHGLCNWHTPKEWPAVSESLLKFFQNTLKTDFSAARNMDLHLYLGILLLSRKLAEMDRLTVLNTLAEHYPVHLYTNSKSSFLSKIQVHPPVDYYTDMTKVFHLSKINLNITLPSIESGLPARIFDIMGSGGFVLTNYQPEIDDLFVIGRELEVFHDLEELLQKTEYYLTHENERIRIAMNGYQKVMESHTYEHRIRTMIHYASLEDEEPRL